MMNPDNPLLVIRNLSTVYRSRGGNFRRGKDVVAVNNVSLSIVRGEIVGLAGGSGSGKSTLARSVLRLIEPEAGEITFEGADVCAMGRRQLRQFRRNAQIVFQDPGAALRPGWTVRRILAEPLLLHGIAPRHELDEHVNALLETVELPAIVYDRYAFELSGGQRQRVAIARALSLRPSFLVADEALSALDLSVQAAMLGLFHSLRERLDLSILLIAHDIEVLGCIADRIAVMDQGDIVEIGAAGTLLSSPQHPATRRLVAATSWRN